MDSLRDVMRSSKKSLQADLLALVHLDGAFSHIPITHGQFQSELTFTEPTIQSDSFTLKAKLTTPNHVEQEIDVLESKITEDGFDITFTQDVD